MNIEIEIKRTYKIICGYCKKDIAGYVSYPTNINEGLIEILHHDCPRRIAFLKLLQKEKYVEQKTN